MIFRDYVCAFRHTFFYFGTNVMHLRVVTIWGIMVEDKKAATYFVTAARDAIMFRFNVDLMQKCHLFTANGKQ